MSITHSLRRPLFVAGIFASLLIFEKLRPLRKPTRPKAARVMSNFFLGGFSTAVMQLSFYPLLLLWAEYATHHGLGLLPRLGLGKTLQWIVTFLGLDWTLYLWHRMNHRLRPLWRFHNVHHTDLDLDVSTAARFHFGELALSTGWAAGQILILGVTPETWLVYQTLVTACAQFHHSNIRLPLRLERFLNRFVVTPRMHGVHHSVILAETDSNYSTILSIWDRVHRTLNLTPSQDEITIGVPAWQNPHELTGLRCLVLPFLHQRTWNPDSLTRAKTQGTQLVE